MNDESKKPRKRGRKGAGSIFRQPGTKRWYIQYYKAGRMYRESTGTTIWSEARDKLNERLGEIQTGQFVGLKPERVKVAELAQLVLVDYSNRGRKSIGDAKSRWTLHVEPYLGNLKAVDVTYAVIEQYKAGRKSKGVSSSTINRALAFLKRAFRLGYKAGLVRYIPAIDMLKEGEPRKGFLEDEQYEKLAIECDKKRPWLRGLFEAGCSFGWRVSELQNLRVRQVDLKARTIRLEVGETKNGDGRVAVMPSMLFSLIAQCVAGKSGDQFVFTRENKPIGDFRVAWYKACCSAGVGRMICRRCERTIVSSESPSWRECPQCKTGIDGLKYAGLIFHDLRRTAVRNMVRRGIPERVAMQISGHRTRSIFDRYNITSPRDLVEAAVRMEQPLPEFKHNFHDINHNRGDEQKGSGARKPNLSATKH